MNWNLSCNCKTCLTPCDSKSKDIMNFTGIDLINAEILEKKITDFFNTHFRNTYSTLNAQRMDQYEHCGYPDIFVFDIKSSNTKWFEIKSGERTFMTVNKQCPHYDGIPSNTLCANTPDIRYYIDFSKYYGIWMLYVLNNRPCLTRFENKEHTRFFLINVNEKFKNYFYENEKINEYIRKPSKFEIENGRIGETRNWHINIEKLIKEVGCAVDIGYDLNNIFYKKKNSHCH